MAPEFCRPVNVADLSPKGMIMDIEASPDERKSLCKRLALEALPHFSASVELQRWRGRGVRVRGSVRASFTQTCVVSMEPLPKTLCESFESFFLPTDLLLVQKDGEGYGECNPDREDPEQLEGDALDVGALVSEQLALALDPYPRLPGVEFEVMPGVSGARATGERGTGARNPFESLQKLKNILK